MIQYPSFKTAEVLKQSPMSTGISSLDRVLDGGLEIGMTHLFYGDSQVNDYLLRLAVQAQLPPSKGGLESPSIILDSSNIINVDKVADYSFEVGLEPETVMDHIFISRAFNSLQTYDLIANQLADLFRQVPARLLFLPGLAGIYHHEGITGEGNQQITHMAHKVMVFTLSRNIITVVSAGSSPRNKALPLGGNALKSCCQIHVYVERTPQRTEYTLAKHPRLPVRRATRWKEGARFGTTLPLECFFEDSDEAGARVYTQKTHWIAGSFRG